MAHHFVRDGRLYKSLKGRLGVGVVESVAGGNVADDDIWDNTFPAAPARESEYNSSAFYYYPTPSDRITNG